MENRNNLADMKYLLTTRMTEWHISPTEANKARAVDVWTRTVAMLPESGTDANTAYTLANAAENLGIA